ncbi:MAG: ATPase [Candidatus Altiarchaeales archaeon HGW-Altiarchaeales-2]|nr:MAG: ATPase [Candidatus Altiarchaeales archaeon HGW-Altiarchaeales-2]
MDHKIDKEDKNKNNTNNSYNKTLEEIFSSLSTNSKGLSDEEAKERLMKYGPNELKIKKRSPLIRFLLQFHNPLIYVLLAAAVICAFLTIWNEDIGMWSEVIVILLCVFLNAIVGFILEGKAESAIEALRRMTVHECTVIRNGKKKTIDAKNLVIGDIVEIESGKKVPADLRLFYVKNLEIDESILTGESIPVHKSDEVINRENLPLSDQRCVAFSGTYVTRGLGKGVVAATAMKTEFGKIAELVEETHKISTPLTKKIEEFIKVIIIATVIFTVINFILGVVMGYSLIYSFLASVSFAVAVIPEALPVIVIALLAIASIAMAKKNAIIRNLPAAETLGCATIICTDKTGTLTKNQMTVVKIYSGGKIYVVSGVGYKPEGKFIPETKGINQEINPLEEPLELIETLRCGYLCNNAHLMDEKGEYGILGDPTEGALIVSAMKANVHINAENFQKTDEIPFESEQQYMATLHSGKEDVDRIIYVKGSPEKILGMCKYQLIDGVIVNLTDIEREEIMKSAHEMAKGALRLIATAHKIADEEKANLEGTDLKNLIFSGIQGMIDPPREEVIDAIGKCKSAGIKVVMITGDHIETAKAIAKQIGFYKEGDKFLSGEDLAKMSDDDLYKIADEISVYARTSPEDKFKIVTQLQKKGHVVAVTGDGVNDAPALKNADIGIAMGISGTEVSKEASDMVLADDNFATIVNAVEEGRHVWKNFQKTLLFTLPTNTAQGFIIFFAILLAPLIPLFALRLPLEPIHILWINLTDAVFLTLPLIMEQKEKGLLKDKPGDQEKLINELFITRVIIVSIMMLLSAFGIYYYFGNLALNGNIDGTADLLLLTQAQTAAFMAVKLVHIGFLFTARSIYSSAFTFSPFSNKWIIIGVIIAFGSQLMITYIPLFQEIFRTAAFPLEWWPILLLTLLSAFIAVEIEKFFRRKFKK